jgi:hypothetical protein
MPRTFNFSLVGRLRQIYGIFGATEAMSLTLQVVSSFDRDQLVTEIWWNDRLVASGPQ